MSKRKSSEATHATQEDAHTRVSYQGIPFSYCFNAASVFFNNELGNVTLKESLSFASVFGAVISGDCHYGVVPIESSYHGTIHGVYDRLVASRGALTILAELSLVEEHCLCVGGKSTGIDIDIDSVHCHPHILECCSDA